ncbi:MAG: hypothetical protein AAB495_01055 [Patescibacteria group bacterium]
MNADLQDKMALWGKRFFILSEGLGVSLAAVFNGEAARKVAGREWLDGMKESQLEKPPGITRLWLTPVDHSGEDKETRFVFSTAGLPLESVFRFEWQLMRWDDELVKAACCRRSEIRTMSEQGLTPPLWGFGRPHPWRVGFKAHPTFAGPLIDFPLGKNPFGSEPFIFEPVVIRVVSKFGAPESPALDYAIEVSSAWEEGSSCVTLKARRIDGDAIPPCLTQANLTVK